MRQLTHKEHQIYSDYIMTELISQFQKYGNITLDDLRQLININYEISEITDNIYPILEFSSDYHAIKNITKFNMNAYPNNLLDEYQIQTINVPSVYLYTGNFTGRLTPYQVTGKDIYDHYLVPYGLTQCFEIEYIPKTILTNGETKYFNFVKSPNSNHRQLYDTTDYELPIDYRSEKSDSISELRDDITNKIEQSLANIKPIDTYQLREIINAHYQKR